MVVGIDSRVSSQFAAKNLLRAVRENLVAVHIEAGTGSHMEDIDRKLIAQISDFGFRISDLIISIRALRKNLVGSLNDRMADLLVEEAEIGVGDGTCLLEKDVSVDHSGMFGESADLKEVTGAFCLGSPIRVLGDFHFAKAVFLNPKFHRTAVYLEGLCSGADRPFERSTRRFFEGLDGDEREIESACFEEVVRFALVDSPHLIQRKLHSTALIVVKV